jgi:hypothetical protein
MWNEEEALHYGIYMTSFSCYKSEIIVILNEMKLFELLSPEFDGRTCSRSWNSFHQQMHPLLNI